MMARVQVAVDGSVSLSDHRSPALRWSRRHLVAVQSPVCRPIRTEPFMGGDAERLGPVLCTQRQRIAPAGDRGSHKRSYGLARCVAQTVPQHGRILHIPSARLWKRIEHRRHEWRGPRGLPRRLPLALLGFAFGTGVPFPMDLAIGISADLDELAAFARSLGLSIRC